MQEIIVSAHKSYPIYIGKELYTSEKIVTTCQCLGNRCVIVTENILRGLYANQVFLHLKKHGVKVDIISVAGGEENKSREMKAQIEDQLLAMGCGRDTVLLALGGGVILDLVGFVAATYCRGISIMYLPTTLLAMVDASVGGKTGVNTPYGKNLIGTFTQPDAVLMNVDTLKTLPARELRNGMAEVIKHAAVFDENAFMQLENAQAYEMMDMIAHSCNIKKTIVEQDEYEVGLRQLLNFGHTIGHALEIASEYKLKHGEAVAFGIWLESIIALKLNYMQAHTLERIKKVIDHYQIISTCNFTIDLNKMLSIMQRDKKVRSGQIHMVLLQDIGQPVIEDGQYSHAIDAQEIRKALADLNQRTVLSC